MRISKLVDFPILDGTQLKCKVQKKKNIEFKIGATLMNKWLWDAKQLLSNTGV